MNYVKTDLGSNVGIQATLLKAEICGLLILANSLTPPDFDNGPTASTRHKINSEQNPVGENTSLLTKCSKVGVE